MANEEISFKLGLDAGPFQRGLTGIKSQLNDLGTEKWAAFKQMFTVGAAVAGLRELGESMVALRRNAEDVGVSTDFLQTIERMSAKFGGTAEDGRASLIKLAEAIGSARTEGGAAAEKFARFGIALYDTNGAAKSSEEIFKAIADAYRNSSDAATKAALAFEFFGRTGRNINNILGEGSSGLDDYTAKMKTFGAVSVESVNAIADAWLNLKTTGTGAGGWLSEMTGRAVQGLAFTMANLGALSGGASLIQALTIAAGTSGIVAPGAENARGQQAADQQIRDAKTLKTAQEELLRVERALADVTDEDRLRTLKNEALAIDEQITGDKTQLETAKLKIELAKKGLEIRNAEKGIQEKQVRLEAERKVMNDKITEARSRLASAVGGLGEAKAERTRYTLEELASGNPRGVRDPGVRQDIFRARELQRILGQAESARSRGDTGLADKLFAQADERRRQIGSLKTDERFPFKALEAAQLDAANSLRALNEAAQGKGIPVVAQMGA